MSTVHTPSLPLNSKVQTIPGGWPHLTGTLKAVTNGTAEVSCGACSFYLPVASVEPVISPEEIDAAFPIHGYTDAELEQMFADHLNDGGEDESARDMDTAADIEAQYRQSAVNGVQAYYADVDRLAIDRDAAYARQKAKLAEQVAEAERTGKTLFEVQCGDDPESAIPF